jgi:uncharacterized protein YutE (UPF0331/DUF86 family)
MSPEVLARKIGRLRDYLGALDAHQGRSADEIAGDPYEVERLLELLVQVGVDALSHLLVLRGRSASSYRDTFLQAGEAGLVDPDLAERLADAAGLRNVLVHLYEEIDYEVVARSVGRASSDFADLEDRLRALLVEMEGRTP